jgi:hypothetical protein
MTKATNQVQAEFVEQAVAAMTALTSPGAAPGFIRTENHFV